MKCKKILSSLGIVAVASATLISEAYAYGNPYGGGWSNCTYGAWQALYDATGIELPNFGDASSWLYSAQSYGYETGLVPVAGAIAVYSHHVAYVSAVDGDSVYIIEGGFNGGYHERWVSSWGTGTQSLQGYIYTNAAVDSSRTLDTQAYESEVSSESGVTEETVDNTEEETVEVAELDATKETSELLDGVHVYDESVENTAVEDGVVTVSFNDTIPLVENTSSTKEAKTTAKQLLKKFQ